MMQRGLTIEQGTNNVLNNCDDDAGITLLPPAVVKGIQDVMALFTSQDSFVEQCEKHDNDDEMISDAAVSVEVDPRPDQCNQRGSQGRTPRAHEEGEAQDLQSVSRTFTTRLQKSRIEQ